MQINFHIKRLWMPVLAMLSISVSYAEGAKELMLDATSRAALCTQGSSSFAGYSSVEKDRLYIHIKDAAHEIVYLNFSLGYEAGTGDLGIGNGSNYYFRIKDPAGNIVFGPQLVNTNPIPSGAAGYDQLMIGPSTLYAGGYSPYTFTPTAGNGDYYIEFNKTSGTVEVTGQCSFDYWDITVANTTSNTPINGRVWAWAFGFYSKDNSGEGGYTGIFKGKLFSYSNDQIVQSIDFANSDLKGGSFRLGVSATGPGVSGDYMADRKSVYNARIVGKDYKIFLNNPDNTAYPSGSLIADAFSMGSTPVTCSSTSVTFNFNLVQGGIAEILLDFNNNGQYDQGTRDRIIGQALPSGSQSLIWDLKDGLGNDVNTTTDPAIKIIATFGQSVSHLTLGDVEYLSGGFIPTVVRPLPPTTYNPKLYYDDASMRASIANPNRQYPDVSLSYTEAAQPAATQLNGCNAPCHLWTNFGTTAGGDFQNNSILGYGNGNSINTWWYSFIERETFTFNIGTCSITPPQPLPVQLIDWSVKPQDNYTAKLEWGIADNDNQGYVEIQRSLDMRSYHTIAAIKQNKDNGINAGKYEYEDRDIALQHQPRASYRLVIVSGNGARTISNSLLVRFEDNNRADIMVYPNPVNDNAQISFNSESGGQAIIRVFDMKGRLIQSQQYTANKGFNTIDYGFKGLTSGIYQVDVMMGGKIIGTKRISK